MKGIMYEDVKVKIKCIQIFNNLYLVCKLNDIGNFFKNKNFSGAKVPPCSSWDTGRVAPFVLVLLTDRIYVHSSVTHRWMGYLSFIWVMHLLADGYSRMEYQSFYECCIHWLFYRKMGGHTNTQTNKQTNSNFINID